MDQTQKYSSLLAQRLGVGGDELLALPAPQAGPKAEDGTLGRAQAAKAPPAPGVKTEEIVINAEDAEEAAGVFEAVSKEISQGAQVSASPPVTEFWQRLAATWQAAVAKEACFPMTRTCEQERWTCRVFDDSSIDYTPSQERHALDHSGADDGMEVSEEDHADSSQAAGPSLPGDQGMAALGQEQPAGEDEGDDFRAGTGSDEEDDEATLEEEEVRNHFAPAHHRRCSSALKGVEFSAGCLLSGRRLPAEVARRAAVIVEHDVCTPAKVKLQACKCIGCGAYRLWLVLLARSQGMRASWRR